MRELGLEPSAASCKDKDLQHVIALNSENDPGGAQEIAALAPRPSGLTDAQQALLSGELAGTIAAWPCLPGPTKAAILAIVMAATQDEGAAP